MDIEGTKHEKAVLIVVAYIIGLTSGFIAFGVTPNTPPTLVDVTGEATAVMGVNPDGSTYVPPSENPPMDEGSADQAAAPTGDTIAAYEDGRLYATVRGERFVLSLHTDVMANDNVEGFSTQGIHTDLPAYQASPDGKYVYFAEKHSEADECSNFIFDTERNVIQPMSLDGKRFTSPCVMTKSFVWNDQGAEVGIYRSVSAATPWKLAVIQ